MNKSMSIFASLLLTSACAFTKDPPRQISYYVYDTKNQQEQTKIENDLINQFYIAGGGIMSEINVVAVNNSSDEKTKITTYQYEADQWWTVVNGAKYRIDRACNDYLSKLNRIDNERKTELAALAIGGPALTAVATTAGASRDALIYLAAALGILGGVPDLAADHFLYGASPAALSSLVDKARRTMWTALQELHDGGGLRTRPSALGGIEAYLQICMPANIRSLADQALEAAKTETAPPTASGEARPLALGTKRTTPAPSRSDGNLPMVRVAPSE